jgi:hypothetical protein
LFFGEIPGFANLKCDIINGVLGSRYFSPTSRHENAVSATKLDAPSSCAHPAPGHDIEHDEGADADEADDQSLKMVSRLNK